MQGSFISWYLEITLKDIKCSYVQCYENKCYMGVFLFLTTDCRKVLSTHLSVFIF